MSNKKRQLGTYDPVGTSKKQKVTMGVPKDQVKNESSLFCFTPPKHTLKPLEWKDVHPTSQSVVFHNNAFYIHGISHKGITYPLQKTFYPKYNFNQASYTNGLPHMAIRPPSTSSSGGWKKKYKSPQQLQNQGMKKGRRLDAHLTQFHSLVTEYHLSYRTFFIEYTLRKKIRKTTLLTCESLISLKNPTFTESKLQAASKKLRTFLNSNLSHARLLIQKWDEMGLRLISTQLPVGCSGVRGTCIDCVLQNPITQQMYITEIKSGGYQHFTYYTEHPMEVPFSDLNDSRMNQALLQAAFGKYYYEMTFPMYKDYLGPALVFRVNEKEDVEWYKVPDSLQQRIPQANELLRKVSLSKSSFVSPRPSSASSSSSRWTRRSKKT
jgi:hypothetical protein